MSALNEFTMNLPMIGATPMGGAVPAQDEVPSAYDEPESYDATLDIEVPDEVSPSFSHIHVRVDNAAATFESDCPHANVDLILDVTITDPTTGRMSSYKMVKRVAFDKVKLALQAESETPVQVVEAITEENKKKKLNEVAAAKRARQLAGLE